MRKTKVKLLLWAKCVPAKFICWKLAPNGMASESEAFGVWLGHNRRGFMNRLPALIRKTPERCLASPPPDPPRVDAVKRQPSVNQEASSHQTSTCWHHNLDFPVSSTMRNKFLLLLSYSMVFCSSSPSRFRQLLSHGLCIFKITVTLIGRHHGEQDLG